MCSSSRRGNIHFPTSLQLTTIQHPFTGPVLVISLSSCKFLHVIRPWLIISQFCTLPRLHSCLTVPLPCCLADHVSVSAGLNLFSPTSPLTSKICKKSVIVYSNRVISN